jgi:serpin B
MRKAIFSVIIAIVLVVVVVGVVVVKDYYDRNTSGSTDVTSVTELVESSNGFAFEMYGELIDGDENVFFSPYSITTALGMAYEGARGQTAEEMAAVLGLPTDNQSRLDLMYSYQGHFNLDSGSYDLSTANAYWLRQGADMLEAYRTAIESYYLAHGEELDFVSDPEGSRETINTWVEEQTNGRIEDLIPQGAIDPLTYLVLTNAIYFKSDWKYQFDPEATFETVFDKSGGENVMVDMMKMDDEDIGLNYTENDDCQMLKLPYKDDELAMYVLLPKENDIVTFESKVENEYLNNLKDDLRPEYVRVYLPKFKFEQKYGLNDILASMGMPTAFTDDADFSGITESVALAITDVIHQSFVEVNEEGTEAAAATAVIVGELSISPQPPVFNADHPFIFFIEHEETGQILFMGKVENPSG